MAASFLSFSHLSNLHLKAKSECAQSNLRRTTSRQSEERCSGQRKNFDIPPKEKRKRKLKSTATIDRRGLPTELVGHLHQPLSLSDRYCFLHPNFTSDRIQMCTDNHLHLHLHPQHLIYQQNQPFPSVTPATSTKP